MGARHQKRPRRQVPEADPPADPARVPAHDELINAEEDEQARARVAQRIERDYDLGHPDDQHRQRDGDGVPQGDGWEGLQDGASLPLLQAQAHRQEPPHGRIEAVVGS